MRCRPPARARAFAERLDQVRSREQRRGEDAEQQAGRDRDGQREEQDRPIERRLRETRDAARADCNQQLKAPVGDGDAERAGQHRQHEAFGQQLPEDPPAGRADRRAHRDLALAAGGVREEQVGDVRACDQHDQADGAEQEQQGALRLADDVVGERDGADPPAAVGRRVGGVEAGRDRVELGLRLFEADAGFQPANRFEVAVVPRESPAGSRRAGTQSSTRSGYAKPRGMTPTSAAVAPGAAAGRSRCGRRRSAARRSRG